MKSLFLFALLLIATTGCADTACMITLRLSGAGTNAATTINTRPVTDVELQQLMTKLGTLSKDQVILVSIDRQVPAHRLLAVMKTLTDAGLRNVCILPNDAPELQVQNVRLLPKTNEFFHVEIEEPQKLEHIEELEQIKVEQSAGR
jgi:hypothetical protein